MVMFLIFTSKLPPMPAPGSFCYFTFNSLYRTVPTRRGTVIVEMSSRASLLLLFVSLAHEFLKCLVWEDRSFLTLVYFSVPKLLMC